MGEVTCPKKDEKLSRHSVKRVRQNYHREVLAAQLELSVRNQEESQAFLTAGLQLVLSALRVKCRSGPCTVCHLTKPFPTGSDLPSSAQLQLVGKACAELRSELTAAEAEAVWMPASRIFGKASQSNCWERVSY